MLSPRDSTIENMYTVRNNELRISRISEVTASSKCNASFEECIATAYHSTFELTQPNGVISTTMPNTCGKLRVIDEEDAHAETPTVEASSQLLTSARSYSLSQPSLSPRAPATPKNCSSTQTAWSIPCISARPETRLSSHLSLPSMSRTPNTIDYLSSPSLSGLCASTPPEARLSSRQSLLSTSRTLTVIVDPSLPLSTMTSSRLTVSFSEKKFPEFGVLTTDSGRETGSAGMPRNPASACPPTCLNPAKQNVSTEHSPCILDWKRKTLDDSPRKVPKRSKQLEALELGVGNNFRRNENYKNDVAQQCEPWNLGFTAQPRQQNNEHCGPNIFASHLLDMSESLGPRFKNTNSVPVNLSLKDNVPSDIRNAATGNTSVISPSKKARAATLTSPPLAYQVLSREQHVLPSAFTVTEPFSDDGVNALNLLHAPGQDAIRQSDVLKSSSFTNSSWNIRRNVEFIFVPEQNKIYRQGKLMGKGGFAKVYLMTDEKTKQNYACKIIPKSIPKKQTTHIWKILQEIDIHRKLNHENVVKMHQAFATTTNVYMLLEACPQKTLMHVLSYRKCLTEPETRYYMKQIVAGVEYIHSQKIIHRDLKPGNMFLSTRMIVKIGDFGLATIADKNRRMTVCGTPNYIAPEMLKQQEYGFEADVWALGCTLHALLMGRPPFESSKLNETYDRIRRHTYLKIGEGLIGFWGEDLINRMLRPSPKDRATLKEVKEHSYLVYEYTPKYLPRTCCYQMPKNSSPGPSESSFVSISRNQETQVHYPAARLDESLRHNKVAQQQSVQVQRARQQQPRRIENSVDRCFGTNSFVSCTWRHKLNELLPFRFRKTLCLKTDGLRKRTNPTLMYHALSTCVKEIKPTSNNPETVDHIMPLFITRWIDFSLKYGLAFKLSDQSIGLVFNDSTKISYTHDRQKVEYATVNDQIERYHRENDMPEQLKEKLKLLHRFTDYLNNRLIDGAELTTYRPPSKQKNAYVPRMKRWMHIQGKGTVMELTKPLLQMNFTKDHTKIVLSYESKATDYLVTYIDASRRMTSYWLNDLRRNGCTADLYCRLLYLHETLRRFNEMDANTVSSQSNAQEKT